MAATEEGRRHLEAQLQTGVQAAQAQAAAAQQEMAAARVAVATAVARAEAAEAECSAARAEAAEAEAARAALEEAGRCADGLRGELAAARDEGAAWQRVAEEQTAEAAEAADAREALLEQLMTASALTEAAGAEVAEVRRHVPAHASPPCICITSLLCDPGAHELRTRT